VPAFRTTIFEPRHTRVTVVVHQTCEGNGSTLRVRAAVERPRAQKIFMRNANTRLTI